MTQGTRGMCIQIPVALAALVIGWTVSSACIGWVLLIGGEEDGRMKTLGFFAMGVAMTATITRASWKTRAMLREAYQLGREDGESERVTALRR